MCGCATITCRPVGHCLEQAVGPIGVIRDPRNLEIPPPSGKEITTEAKAERCAADTSRPRAQGLNHALGLLGPSTLARPGRTV